MTVPSRHRRWFTAGVLTTATLVALNLAGPSAASAAPPGDDIRPAGTTAVAGSYIVVLKNTAALQRDGVDATARGLTRTHGGAIGHTFRHALRGFEVSLGEAAARRQAG